MSIQKDFILRMIEMMGDLVAALLGKIKRGETHIAEEQIEQYYSDFLKKDASFFRNLPIEDITETLLNEHNYTSGHLQILAELFYAEGELRLATGNDSAKEYFQKSLVLHEYVDNELRTFDLKRQNRLVELKSKIDSLA